jgi:hypothetical protein
MARGPSSISLKMAIVPWHNGTGATVKDRGPSAMNNDLIFLPPYIYYCFKNEGEGFDPEGRVIPAYKG